MLRTYGIQYFSTVQKHHVLVPQPRYFCVYVQNGLLSIDLNVVIQTFPFSPNASLELPFF